MLLKLWLGEEVLRFAVLSSSEIYFIMGRVGYNPFSLYLRHVVFINLRPPPAHFLAFVLLFK